MEPTTKKRLQALVLHASKTKKALQELGEIVAETPLRDKLMASFSEDQKTPDLMTLLVSDLSYRFVPKGRLIYQEGADNDNLYYYVLSGELGAFRKNQGSLLFKSNVGMTLDKNMNLLPVSNMLQNNRTKLAESTIITPGDVHISSQTSAMQSNGSVSGLLNGSQVYLTEGGRPQPTPGQSTLHPQNVQGKSFFRFFKKFDFLNSQNTAQHKILRVFEKYHLRDRTRISFQMLNQFFQLYGSDFQCFLDGQIAGYTPYGETESRGETLIAMKNTELVVINNRSHQAALESLEKIKATNFKTTLQKALKCRFLEADFQFVNGITTGIEVC